MARRKRNLNPRKKKVLPARDSKGDYPPATRIQVWQTSWFPWVSLVFLASLAYFNAWPDVFVFDDREFLSNGRFANLTISEFANLFGQSLWEASGNTTPLYRPMFVLTLGLEYLVFGDWAAGFHLFNILLHIVAVCMVYGFTRLLSDRLLPGSNRKRPVALLASAIYAIHPAFSEVVNSVFNGSEIYIVIGVAGGLWYLLRHIEERPVRAWLLLALVYFLILLYRESAVSLPALAVVTLWFSSSRSRKQKFKQSLPVLILLIPLAGYLALRSHAMDAPDRLGDLHEPGVEIVEVPDVAGEEAERFDRENFTPSNGSGSGPANPRDSGLKLNSDRLSSAVIVWFDGLKKLAWPHPLLTLHGASDSPLYLAALVQITLLLLAAISAMRHQPAFLLGLAIYYLAILPSSRIIAESGLAPVLMERMLYLPSVGIVIFLAAAFSWMADRASIKVPVIITIMIIALFMPVTWARNANWSSDLSLMQHDFYVKKNHGQLFYSLIAANRRAGAYGDAMKLCDRYTSNFPDKVHVQLECGKSFAANGNFNRAEDYFKTALKSKPGNAWAHFELARLCVITDRRDLAKNHFDQAISNESLPFLQELFAAFKLMDLYPYDRQRLLEASEHVDNALQLQPRSREAKQLRQQLDQRL